MQKFCCYLQERLEDADAATGIVDEVTLGLERKRPQISRVRYLVFSVSHRTRTRLIITYCSLLRFCITKYMDLSLLKKKKTFSVATSTLNTKWLVSEIHKCFVDFTASE